MAEHLTPHRGQQSGHWAGPGWAKALGLAMAWVAAGSAVAGGLAALPDAPWWGHGTGEALEEVMPVAAAVAAIGAFVVAARVHRSVRVPLLMIAVLAVAAPLLLVLLFLAAPWPVK